MNYQKVHFLIVHSLHKNITQNSESQLIFRFFCAFQLILSSIKTRNASIWLISKSVPFDR